MRARWLLALLAALALAGTASATHDELTVPLHEGEETVDEGLSWVEAERATDEGCIHDAYDEECYVERTKWWVATLGHAGVDPATWPSEDGSSLDWLLDRADDLRDEELLDCQQSATTSSDCADKRVFSLAKAILAFEATGEDPRSIPLPDGGERDLVDELLDEHGGTEFGRVDVVNDDIWALIALNDVDYDGPEVDDALDRIEAAQNADGGLGYAYDTSSSVDMTAAAIMAGAPHDAEDILDEARDYLADEQLASGEDRACWSISTDTSTEANAESTAWALQAVVALDEDPLTWSQDGQSPPECLTSFQASEGGFRHAEGSKIEFLPTRQALAALAWRPYGDLDGPADTLASTDQATVDEQHTATVPGAQLRLDRQGVDEHAWTPNETGERTFHGFDLDPARPVELVVAVDPADNDDEAASSGEEDPGESDAGTPPSVRLSAPERAERNVSTTVEVEAEPGDHPVTSFRLQVGDRAPTEWQPAGTFQVRLDELGERTLQAWARDADGQVSEPAQTHLEVVDATPRVAIEGPDVVNRTNPPAFRAAAEDPDGTVRELVWTGPAGQRAEGPRATFAFPQPGETRLELVARDDANNTARANATVHALNQAPGNLGVEPGTLEANASATVRAIADDPEDDDLRYAWRAPDAEEPRSWGRQLHLDTGPPGERELVLNVSDAHGTWTSARVTLTVRERPDNDETPAVRNVTSWAPQPEARAPDPGEDRPPARVELPDVVEAQAQASRVLGLDAQSPRGPVVNVTVALGGPVPVQGTEDARALLPALPPGEYELAARAADQAGWGPWTNATLVVQPTSEDPVETASDPAERQTPLGALAALAGLALAARRART
jgi:hypothetical protein